MTFFDRFKPFFTLSGWGILGHFGTKIGSFWGHFGIVVASFSGIILGSFWCCFDPILRHLGALFRLFFDHFLRSYLRSFCSFFLEMFCEVDCKIKQYDAREGKNMQNSAKIHQNYAKLSTKKTRPFFAYKTIVLLKKRSKSTSQPVKVCSEWVCLEMSWVGFECYLCTFMKVCMTFERFFGYF